jgi:glyoxylase-like metal-dependent hydrolase (beta-lactamase superfamily II)
MENFMSGQIKRIAERISEIAPGILRIVIPLPIPDVGSMNSYVVVDEDRNLMVDPGMAHPASSEAIEKAIEDLGLDMERTDFFITHHHLDHFGAVSKLLRGSSRIYISKPEADFIERVASGEVVEEMAVFFGMLGFPELKPMDLVSMFYGSEYRQRRSWPFHYVVDGDAVVRGGYRFTCLVAPGHSIAHGCLHESNRGILISGDRLTAGVQFMVDRADPFADHFQSLDQLREMDVKLVLPGHGSPFSDHRKRIDQLRAHHEGRMEAIHSVLGRDGKDAYEVTLALDKRLPDRDALDRMSPVMRFIHTRHTFGYLRHLTIEGRARQESCHGRILFSSQSAAVMGSS